MADLTNAFDELAVLAYSFHHASTKAVPWRNEFGEAFLDGMAHGIVVAAAYTSGQLATEPITFPALCRDSLDIVNARLASLGIINITPDDVTKQ